MANELERLYSYASLLADQDTRDSAHQGMRQEMVQVAAAFSAAAAYVDPEILKAGKATIDKFVAAEPRLKPYRMKLDDVVRRAAHTLSDSEEKLLADLQPVSGSAQNVFSILSNADFPYPTVTLSDGRSVRLDQPGYSAARAVANRADREKAMSAFFTSLGSFSRTFGTTMNAEAQKVLFHAKTRRYASALESELDGPNIPVSVYNRLVEGVNRNLPSFHRYLKLRKRMMGVDQLHYYDLYAPLVASVNLTYTPEEAQRLVIEAVEPLGKEYAATIQKAFGERWIDLFPSVGKRSGAYSNGIFSVHPYMLINYNGKYDDVSTLAHELGHTMHSYLSAKTQPYATCRLPDLRRRGRLHVQRVAPHRPHAQAAEGRRRAAVDPRQLPREHQGDGLPADAVRRVRAAHARDGGQGPADHRRRTREAVSRHHAPLLRARPGRARWWTTTSPTSGA